MYKCNECDYVFSVPQAFVETHGLSSPPYERVYACPNCNSLDFDIHHSEDTFYPYEGE